MNIINYDSTFKASYDSKPLRVVLDNICQIYSEEVFNTLCKEQFFKTTGYDYYDNDYFAYVYASGIVSSLDNLITITAYETYYDDNNEFVTNLLYSWDNIVVWKAIFILYYSTDLPDFDYEPTADELNEFYNDVLPYLKTI